MTIKKRIGKIVKTIVVLALVSLIGQYLWNAGFHEFFPWTKTDFESYTEFTGLLIDRSFAGRDQFINNFPENSSGAKYYVEGKYLKKTAAYSVVLDENAYKTSIENQKAKHQRLKWESRELIYQMDENDCWSMSDLKQLELDTGFLDEVIHKPDEEQKYYCVVVMSIGTTRGNCYTGVIANDTTREMIEFAVEIRELD